MMERRVSIAPYQRTGTTLCTHDTGTASLVSHRSKIHNDKKLPHKASSSLTHYFQINQPLKKKKRKQLFMALNHANEVPDKV